MYDSLSHDLISLILHSLCFLLFWFAAIKRIEPYFRSDPGIRNLSGASVLIASLMKVRVGARLNFLMM